MYQISALYLGRENDQLTEVPTVEKPDDIYGNQGLAVPDWVLEDMIPDFTR